MTTSPRKTSTSRRKEPALDKAIPEKMTLDQKLAKLLARLEEQPNAVNMARSPRPEEIEELDKIIEKFEHILNALNVQSKPKPRFSTIMSLAGAGITSAGPLSAEEINAHIRWLRGDE